MGVLWSVAGMRRMRLVSSVFRAAEMRRMSWVVVVVSGGRDCVSAAFVCVVMRVEGGMRISVCGWIGEERVVVCEQGGAGGLC